MLYINAVEIRLGERNIKQLCSCVPDNQQRSFSGSELNILDATDFASAVEYDGTNKIADVVPACFQPGALGAWNLQLAADQRFGCGNAIYSGELQHQKSFMRPEFFHFKFPPAVFR